MIVKRSRRWGVHQGYKCLIVTPCDMKLAIAISLISHAIDYKGSNYFYFNDLLSEHARLLCQCISICHDQLGTEWWPQADRPEGGLAKSSPPQLKILDNTV